MSERGMVIGYPSRDDSLEGPKDPAEGARAEPDVNPGKMGRFPATFRAGRADELPRTGKSWVRKSRGRVSFGSFLLLNVRGKTPE